MNPRFGTHLHFSILLLFCSFPARAGQFSTSGLSGTGTYSRYFSYSQREEAAESSIAKVYSASYTFTRTEVGSTSGEDTDLFNLTHSVSGGVSFIEDWRYGGRITYSTTPEEFLSSFGVMFHGAWDFNDDQEEDSRKEKSFQPWGLRADVGYNQYSHSLQGSSSGRRRRGSDDADSNLNLGIGQIIAEASAWLDTTDWMSLRFSYTRFFYTRNVSEFLNILDDPRAIASSASQFGSTLAGFSSSGWVFGVDFSAPFKTYLSLGTSLYRNASSNNSTRGYSVELSKGIGAITPGLSFDRYVTAGAQQDLFGFSLSFRI